MASNLDFRPRDFDDRARLERSYADVSRGRNGEAIESGLPASTCDECRPIKRWPSRVWRKFTRRDDVPCPEAARNRFGHILTSLRWAKGPIPVGRD